MDFKIVRFGLRFLNPPRSWYPKAPRIFIWFSWCVLKTIGFLFGFRCQSLENLPKKGPCLVIVPHVNFIDPLFLLASFPRPPRFIADAFFTFSNPFFAWAMWMAGVVPVDKSKPDPKAVRQYLRLLAQGEICVLFPEGSRSLNAEITLPMVPATKLISKVQVPIATCVIEGAYDAWPKWDPLFRLPWKSICVKFKGFFREKPLSFRVVNKNFWWEKIYDWNKKTNLEKERGNIKQALAQAVLKESANVALTRWRRPQSIVNMLCLCPICSKPNGLIWFPQTQKLSCQDCSASFSITETNLTLTTKIGTVTHSLVEWFHLIERRLREKSNQDLFITAKVSLKTTPPGKTETASLRIDQEGLFLHTQSGATWQIPLGSAAKASPKGSSVLEITYQNQLFTLTSQNTSVFAWLILLRKLAGWQDYFAET